MGWVDDRFRDHLMMTKQLPRLWNQLRDRIGEAALEYNRRVDTFEHVDHTDCLARGQYCTRLHKASNGATLEVFLDEKERKVLRSTSQPGPIITVCDYRLTQDRNDLEFFRYRVEQLDTITVSVESVCELALETFLFDPFPTRFRTDV